MPSGLHIHGPPGVGMIGHHMGLTSAFRCWPWPHLTAASIATGVAVTLAEFQFTVDASEARATSTGVAPLPTVGARCPILAWGMVGAIVEICRGREVSPLSAPCSASSLPKSGPETSTQSSSPPSPMKSCILKHLEPHLTSAINQSQKTQMDI